MHSQRPRRLIWEKRGTAMSTNILVRGRQLRAIALVGALLALALGLSFSQSGLVWAEDSSGSYTASGKASAKIILTLGTISVSLSGVDPDCAAVSGITAYLGSSGNEGCAYRWTVSVQVESNRAWTGTLSGADNGNPTSEITVDEGSFYASTKSIDSYSDCTGATVVPDSKNAWTWESNGKKGNNSSTHYHCVVVDWDDDDGSINSTFSYSVSQ